MGARSLAVVFPFTSPQQYAGCARAFGRAGGQVVLGKCAQRTLGTGLLPPRVGCWLRECVGTGPLFSVMVLPRASAGDFAEAGPLGSLHALLLTLGLGQKLSTCRHQGLDHQLVRVQRGCGVRHHGQGRQAQGHQVCARAQCVAHDVLFMIRDGSLEQFFFRGWWAGSGQRESASADCGLGRRLSCVADAALRMYSHDQTDHTE